MEKECIDNRRIKVILKKIKGIVSTWKSPVVSEVAQKNNSPFQVLIGCILSLRTKDDVTRAAHERLFEMVDSPESLAKFPLKRIEEAIYPVGFYRTKAKRIKEISKRLISDYNSRVPDSLNELLKFKGVGRKTANLVITIGYNKPGICVDTHVHRISNRLGFVKTETPEKTEFALREKLPKKYWIEYNDLLVTFGQNMCKPISPLCSQCPVDFLCLKIGVDYHR